MHEVEITLQIPTKTGGIIFVPRGVANRSTVVGVFSTAAQADKAVDALLVANFTNSQIGVVSTENDHYREKMKTSTAEGDQASTGAVTGAVAGAGIGGLIGLGVLAGVVPVIGPAIAAGTLGTLLSNVALGINCN